MGLHALDWWQRTSVRETLSGQASGAHHGRAAGSSGPSPRYGATVCAPADAEAHFRPRASRHGADTIWAGTTRDRVVCRYRLACDVRFSRREGDVVSEEHKLASVRYRRLGRSEAKHARQRGVSTPQEAGDGTWSSRPLAAPLPGPRADRDARSSSRTPAAELACDPHACPVNTLSFWLE